MNISESLHEILHCKHSVVARFYETLLAQHPELKHHFESRNMEIQASIVTLALVSVEGYYTHKYPAIEHYLQVLGHRHYHNGIHQEDFPKFRDALLITLQEFHGSDWSVSLQRAWYEAINLAIAQMLKGYVQNYTY